MGRSDIALLLGLCIISPILALPSLVVNSGENTGKELNKEDDTTEHSAKTLEIYQMHVQSEISNRFANTTIISKVRNLADKPQEAYFSVVLPDSAFISGFIMEVGGKNYTAYVKEKEEAKRDYDQAVSSGLGAAHVAVSARDSNRFTVSVNVESATKAAFYLTYEQLLKRADGRYEQVINLHPGQPVTDLSVEVTITESRKITDLKAPPLRSGNEIGSEKAELDPRAAIEIIDDKKAVVRFSPNIERQKQLAHLLGTDEKEGLTGQFVVQYDVARDPQGGEVLVQDGYFVHFFAPTELAPLSKHVVFVLDTSGSMSGQKIEQLKEAMIKILEQLHDGDLFSLVEFSSIVKVWDLDNPDNSTSYPAYNYYQDYSDRKDVHNEDRVSLKAYPVNADNIKKAKNIVSLLRAGGGTSIYKALWIGLKLVELENKEKSHTTNRQPIMVFLTDGQPSYRSTEEIVVEITKFNTGERRTPIFSLSFGLGADEKFLQKLSLRNSGFSKHIYEASDASLQLQDFYRQISSPLLANVTFKYAPSTTSLTTTEFPFYFGRSEIVVAGRYEHSESELPIVSGCSMAGPIILKPTVERSVSSIERLWAYLTVKQLLDQKETSDEDKTALNKKALDLALRYSFVTPITSMVVVKPNDTSAVDSERAATTHKHAGGSYSTVNSLRRSHIQPFLYSRKQVHVSHYDSPMAASMGFPQTFAAEALPIAPSATWPTTTSTAVPTETTQATTGTPDLLAVLPWLKNILNQDGTLHLPTGDQFKLGLNETVNDAVECSNTPLNSTGHCSLLHSCPQIHSLLTSSDVFVQHMCVLKNEYAGVCCP